jgi:acid-sensing ion channel, other
MFDSSTFSELTEIYRLADDFKGTNNFSPRFMGTNHGNVTKYPTKAQTSHGNGLKIVLNHYRLEPLFDFCTFLAFLIHSPFELPGSYEKEDMFTFELGFDLQVLITPEIVRTDESLRSLSPEKRGCYFEGERKLEYFKVYTKRNCEFECYSGIMQSYSELNCTPYYAVRDNSMEVCDYRQEYFVQRLSYDAMREKEKCNCLDACNFIKYSVEVIPLKLKNRNQTSLEFKFKETDIVPLLRYIPLTFSEFLAQSGGLMGLFAGISVLSIFEVVYFASLRWIVDLWRRLKCCRN